MTRLFFFYGTLMGGGGNPVARAAHGRLRFVGPAKVRGTLFAIHDDGEWYPALLTGEGVVRGHVYEALEQFGTDDLALLDRYEGDDYRRRALLIDGFGEAVAYWWIAPLPAGAEPIPDGDFPGWLAASGRRAFGG